MTQQQQLLNSLQEVVDNRRLLDWEKNFVKDIIARLEAKKPITSKMTDRVAEILLKVADVTK